MTVQKFAMVCSGLFFLVIGWLISATLWPESVPGGFRTYHYHGKTALDGVVLDAEVTQEYGAFGAWERISVSAITKDSQKRTLRKVDAFLHDGVTDVATLCTSVGDHLACVSRNNMTPAPQCWTTRNPPMGRGVGFGSEPCWNIPNLNPAIVQTIIDAVATPEHLVKD